MFRNSGIRRETFSTRAVTLRLWPCELYILRLSEGSYRAQKSACAEGPYSLIFQNKTQIAYA